MQKYQVESLLVIFNSLVGFEVTDLYLTSDVVCEVNVYIL